MNNSGFLRLISFLLLSLMGGQAIAGELPGAYWKTRSLPEMNAVEFRLYRKDGKLTNVFYRIDLKYGLELSSESRESETGLIIPRPGRTLWEPHPAQNRTLEKNFLAAATEFYGKIEARRPVEKKTDGTFSVRDIREDLSVFESRVKQVDEKALRESLEGAVLDGWQKILHLRFGVSVPTKLISLFRKWDPIGPSVSKEGPAESRFDAFAIYPAQVYLEAPELFTRLMTEVSADLQWDPIGTLLREQTPEARRVRLALLILVTHNHASEANLLRVVLARQSPTAAWDVLKKMNALYARVRSPQVSEEGTRHFVGCGGAGPIDLLEQKAYHYLGAWALSLRMDETLSWVPRLMREAMLRYATESYIGLTDSDASRRAGLRKYYDSALQHVKACRENPPTSSERLWK